MLLCRAFPWPPDMPIAARFPGTRNVLLSSGRDDLGRAFPSLSASAASLPGAARVMQQDVSSLYGLRPQLASGAVPLRRKPFFAGWLPDPSCKTGSVTIRARTAILAVSTTLFTMLLMSSIAAVLSSAHKVGAKGWRKEARQIPTRGRNR